MAVGQLLRAFVIRNARRRNDLNFSTCAARFVSSSYGASRTPSFRARQTLLQCYGGSRVVIDRCKIPPLSGWWQHFGTESCYGNNEKDVNHQTEDEADEGAEDTDGWEDDDETKPEYGDGGAGGGVVLQNVPWGDQVLSIACEVLQNFGDDMELYAFKTTPRGYIYVRLDKLSNVYGCPDIEELEKYNREYKKKLDEIGVSGDIPDDLAVEVSSPGAERLLKVPDDLNRFKDLPMRVCYVEDDTKWEKESVFLLENIDTELGACEWKLADVKANSNLTGKGRPLSRKLKDWRLKLPYAMFKKVSLYLES